MKANLDLLWRCSLLFEKPHPSWSEYMQGIHKGPQSGKSTVMFLPMIDMHPTEPACILSTLNFLHGLAAQHNFMTVVTFDQPLFYKAYLLINNQPPDSPLRKIIVRLGGFHTIMSFLGAIGTLMGGSGIEEILGTIYGSVEHILCGKAVSRGIRAHLLMDESLPGLMLSDILNLPLFADKSADAEQNVDPTISGGMPEEPSPIVPPLSGQQHTSCLDSTDAELNVDVTVSGEMLDEPRQIAPPSSGQENPSCLDPPVEAATFAENIQLLEEVQECYNALLKNQDEINPEERCSIEALKGIEKKLIDKKDSLKLARTPQIWLMYCEMIQILMNFIKAERLGDWLASLDSLKLMLPYLAATGHKM